MNSHLHLSKKKTCTLLQQDKVLEFQNLNSVNHTISQFQRENMDFFWDKISADFEKEISIKTKIPLYSSYIIFNGLLEYLLNAPLYSLTT